MDVTFSVKDGNKVIAEVEITGDGHVSVKTAGKQVIDSAAPVTAQYVWGSTKTANYVWGGKTQAAVDDSSAVASAE
ncbi:hypothetical protein SAMN02982917_5590 [Azospirillum oryzae]|uniref:Uncharacterized protein n=1 Tax=Azospirillum oryzae TaxID=286727 RepID=A0A1X7HC03_9PROT|nr:hypothetical protein [Azospirillum oryzae]SMF83658.1 hypothetical protein SAMN02982917_5590 [Azospirillum oryzae]